MLPIIRHTTFAAGSILPSAFLNSVQDALIDVSSGVPGRFIEDHSWLYERPTGGTLSPDDSVVEDRARVTGSASGPSMSVETPDGSAPSSFVRLNLGTETTISKYLVSAPDGGPGIVFGRAQNVHAVIDGAFRFEGADDELSHMIGFHALPGSASVPLAIDSHVVIWAPFGSTEFRLSYSNGTGSLVSQPFQVSRLPNTWYPFRIIFRGQGSASDSIVSATLSGQTLTGNDALVPAGLTGLGIVASSSSAAVVSASQHVDVANLRILINPYTFLE